LRLQEIIPMEKESDNSNKKEPSYAVKVWQTTAIVCLAIIGILILRVAFNILLMALAGVLIAVYFHGVADMIMARIKMNRKLALSISIGGTIVLLVFLSWFIGSKVQRQVAELSNTLPQTINVVRAKISRTPVGQKVIEYSSGNNSQKLIDTAATFFSTSFGIIGDLYIILFLGIFFTADPALYKNGILFLFPVQKKSAGRIILKKIETALKGWLKSILLSIVLITILIAFGLYMAGLPATMVLGLITGMLEIIPNFGPVIAMIPGVLLAFTISTKTAVIVALIYIACQTIVGNIAMPLLQKKIINIPPALTLLSQLIMGTLSGLMGIVLAVPLLAILIILVNELYVKKQGGNEHDQYC
jgi:predicted PurR-regulated permease PerM